MSQAVAACSGVVVNNSQLTYSVTLSELYEDDRVSETRILAPLAEVSFEELFKANVPDRVILTVTQGGTEIFNSLLSNRNVYIGLLGPTPHIQITDYERLDSSAPVADRATSVALRALMGIGQQFHSFGMR